MTAIYRIVNTVNGRAYVGASRVDVGWRFELHRGRLRAGAHWNHALQADWHEHGEPAFRLEVLEQVGDWTVLREREQAWIDQQGELAYNYDPSTYQTPETQAAVEHNRERMRRYRAKLMHTRIGNSRRRRVMTQKELAEKAGVSKATIVKIEAGAIHPHPGTIRKLAEALGVEPEELLEESDWKES
jgi:group I intron endonuclease